MNRDTWLEEAAAYALGALDPEARARFEATLAEQGESGARDIAEFAAAAAQLALVSPAVPAPVRLRRRLLSRVGDEQGYYFLDHPAGEYEQPSPGVSFKRLFVDPADERESRWIELAAGTHDIGALLPEGSGVFVLEGALQLGDLELGTRDWHRLSSAPQRVTGLRQTRLAVFDAIAGAQVRPGTVRADEGVWQELGPGSAGRVLELDDARGGNVMEFRMAPGGQLPAHGHGGPEQVILLEGDCAAMSRTFSPGDFHRIRAGLAHGPATTRGGCRILNVAEGALLPV